MFDGIPHHETLVKTRDTDEIFTAGKQTELGVEFDAGVIPWENVAGLWNYCATAGRWLFIPVG